MRRLAAAAALVVLLIACGHDDHRDQLLRRCASDTDHVAECGAIVNYAISAASAKGCHDLQVVEAVDRLAQPLVFGRQTEAEFNTTFATCDRPGAPLPAGWPFQSAPPSTTVYVPPPPLQSGTTPAPPPAPSSGPDVTEPPSIETTGTTDPAG